MIEQPLLAVETAAIAGQGSIGADHSVAGNHDRNGVAPVGGSDRAGRAGTSDPPRLLGITDGRSERDIRSAPSRRSR